MRRRNMLKISLVFWKSEPQYAYKGYAYKKQTCSVNVSFFHVNTLAVVKLISSFPSLLKHLVFLNFRVAVHHDDTLNLRMIEVRAHSESVCALRKEPFQMCKKVHYGRSLNKIKTYAQ